MFVLPVKTRFKSQTASDPSKPISRGGKSNEELRVMGEHSGFADRQLSAVDVENMGADELLWFERFFPHRLEQAATREATKKANRENKEAWEVKKMWEDGGEEIEAALPEVSKFVAAHPQFIGSNEENRKAIVNWLVQMNVRCTYENLVRAFQDLAAAGKLTLRDGYTELSGDALKNSPRLRVLLEAQTQPLPADESADAFYVAHKELHPGKPYLIRAREQQMQQTQEFVDEAAKATTKGSVVNVTDYQQHRNGGPPLPDKPSFRMKVRSMSAAEVLQRCSDDPAFKKALDALE